MMLRALALSVCLVCDLAASGFAAEGSKLPSVKLKTLDGKLFTTSSLQGKVGVVVFLRPGQKDSRSVLRELKRLETALGGASWETVGICSGQVEREAVQRMLRRTKFSGTLLLDPERKAYASFGVVAVPSLAMFDAGSKIVFSRPGFGSDFVFQVSENLRRLLGIARSTPDLVNGLRASTATVELARGMIDRGKLEGAESLLRENLEKEPSLEGFLELGEVLLRREKGAEALRLLEAARKKYPVPRLEIGIARALAALGRNEDAERMLSRTALRLPGSWEAHFVLGQIYENLGKKDLALREYKKTISLLESSLKRTAAGRSQQNPAR